MDRSFHVIGAGLALCHLIGLQHDARQRAGDGARVDDADVGVRERLLGGQRGAHGAADIGRRMDAHDALALLDELLERRDEVAGVGRRGLGQFSARAQSCHEGGVVHVHALAKRLLTEVDHPHLTKI